MSTALRGDAEDMEITDDLIRHQLRGRWVEVAKIQAQERRDETEESRWKRFCALIGLAAVLGLDLGGSAPSESAVWERWQQLRRVHLS
jgi:hypothetical protein